ncbi:cytochrome c oxidase cbb3-type subunit 1 [Sphingobacterium yanglingense]|uniref:Cytochrome c oxidase cbb3-type subunit 1 n=2 Tax=Sphingobacterium yanglingense TaxID=1437280 RepID=A0A4R6WK17_9SPHI|nr:cytochrome c oxidase cbb3-type subunit 1 [Sphingobacterium yanglingense]
MAMSRFYPLLFSCLLLYTPQVSKAHVMLPTSFSFRDMDWITCLGVVLVLFLFIASTLLYKYINQYWQLLQNRMQREEEDGKRLEYLIRDSNAEQISRLWNIINQLLKNKRIGAVLFFMLGTVLQGRAQFYEKVEDLDLLSQGGVLVTMVLVAIPLVVAIILLVVQIRKQVRKSAHMGTKKEAEELATYMRKQDDIDAAVFEKRMGALQYRLSDQELSGEAAISDEKGLLQSRNLENLPFVAKKRKALPRPKIDASSSRLIQWFIGTATFWLLFGTTVGEYLGIKFIAPDAEAISWLSFGRLRPVHTNAVFWGWSSLGMIGLGYYIVAKVSNVQLQKVNWGWYSLILINASVLLGSLSLMAGINNGGGEYREYIWPIMLLFALGLAFTLGSYLKTIAKRETKEIYISNWYIVSAVLFISIVAVVGYLPSYQDGLGETIIQGYYMHQAVGMWFMLFTLGIVYYFLPQQLNRPIYSYSLGILAFWTQILFYTLIGTHHFVFSAIPWWLQTVAIVASAGMVIPVAAGTTNFIMTFRGAWHKVRDSYSLPFFVVGIVFYFTGSMQGTAEAFRYTNLLWHFTDFTVAHSHMTMYGIIAFLLWGGIYALLPRLTGKESGQAAIGTHFWLALIGLMIYSVSLMYGGTLRGLAWMENVPFIDSVTLMMPYWLWRAIGGTLMWISHIIFAYNVFQMMAVGKEEKSLVDQVVDYLEKENIETN